MSNTSSKKVIDLAAAIQMAVLAERKGGQGVLSHVPSQVTLPEPSQG